ncbi:ABC transporter permease [Nocardia seriolae]|uniref:ABC transporter permease n=1 Tax=Nocardia seriolae TaxID=37332 RepID=A0A0B8N2W8_9NOCA|nr:ABC transporter permease [Nocardia seriolae]APA96053.1 Carnitine transport permease protein OpuCD [Nocardia seriolae]MTJ65867.1 ABC transporter permease subunit [Nocardia seriolae]MTJ72341.1 ABC transporter permease subunit [Nocardia seriolae]MTJ86204.1 ABC transporter permease subunit [Nocardia seriolae]MTK30200.1 ABC transporter permease subunit [Nocardia seriolae]
MSLFADAWSFLTDGANWSGPAGIWQRILQHLWYSLLAVGLSAAIAVPIGLLIGHTRRGSALIVGFANSMRALPTLGVLTFVVLWLGLGLTPPLLALLTVGIPPLLAGSYAGIANVDPTVVDASRAMGMSEPRVLLQVELPNALPVLLSGLRAATLQVVATATIAAYVNLGGLGRYIFDGISLYRYDKVLVGAILVAALALVLDGLLAFAVWLSAPGTGRLRRVTAPARPLKPEERLQ